jgi:hypothetical protein
MEVRPRLVNGSGPPHIGPVSLERREKCRFYTVMRVARVLREQDAGLWRVRNVSDDGMMLAASVPVTPGEPLEIALSENVEISGKAMWWDGQRCGVKFDAPIDCAATLKGLVAHQRTKAFRQPRLPVETRAVICCERGLHAVRLHDLSQNGAGFTHDGAFREGMNVRLLFENGEKHRGVVRWTKGDRAGLYLYEPFPCEALESAARL